jgi:opacity protein-like surface antigen
MIGITSVRKSVLLGAGALVLLLSGSSGTWAQALVVPPPALGPTATANCTSTQLRAGLIDIGSFVASTASSVAGSLGNVNTAFLTQQGSAFVANPGGAPPNTQGGGVWVRGVGGEVTIKSTSVSSAVANPILDPAVDVGSINCANKERLNFAGVQVGTDVARLNLDGWNINIGSTAGYLEARGRESGLALRTNFEVPFLGAYLVVTRGGFFADLMVRGEFYNIELNDPASNLHQQPFSARGLSVSTSAGYNMPLVNNWFIEPSLGFIWSRTKVDAFNVVGLPEPQLGAELSGTLKINDIDSQLGRASIRIGTSYTSGNLALQPFASASVFHEFAGAVTSSFVSCPFCVFVGATPITNNIFTATSRVGTYGQFSLGLAGQVLNTGWVGFVRGDYRTGDHIEGWTANAGLRYNFLPVAVAAPVVTKGPAIPAPVIAAVDWTGFYVGGFFGGGFGTSSMTFLNDGNVRPRIAGPLGGGTLGYNWQLGRYVVGLEGDVAATNIHGSRTCGAATGIVPATGLNTSFSPFFLTCTSDMDVTATLAARLGVSWERALFYVKAGGAWTSQDLTVSCIIGPNNGNPLNARNCLNQAGVLTNGFTASNDRFGLVAGWGTEFALTANWSAKAEYNFMSFDRDTVRASDGITVLSDKTWVNEVKVGVNYRFGPGGLLVR